VGGSAGRVAVAGEYDFLVIGGGIVGAATAWRLLQVFPGRRVLVLEKEAAVARHQTGRNSGVIHAGVYYAPGSLKARFCREGLHATIAFCRAHDLPWQQCGKLLVATDAQELQRMQALRERCTQNGIAVELLDAAALREREPDIVGCGALYVAATGMTDYAQLTRKLFELFRAAGGEVRTASEVVRIDERADRVHVHVDAEEFQGRQLVVCAGAMSDRLARLQGLPVDFQIVPFRGEYFRLRTHSATLRHHIYPIPDPRLPFLGIHLTRMIDGGITVGPNAVLAPGREAYDKCRFDWRDLLETAAFPGFWRMLPEHWRAGAAELRNSVWVAGYLREVQKYCPRLQLADLQPHPAGIRAQAVDRRGQLLQDFLLLESARSLHVCNAPSPAATSALPIARHIVARIAARIAGASVAIRPSALKTT
jgi:L-2-hydroxyglutarate oxidase